MITHDLGVVAGMADTIAVMYAGCIVEYGNVFDIFNAPQHPYTNALLNAVPRLNVENKAQLEVIPGTPPDLISRRRRAADLPQGASTAWKSAVRRRRNIRRCQIPTRQPAGSVIRWPGGHLITMI